jgi:hypothetical protein
MMEAASMNVVVLDLCMYIPWLLNAGAADLNAPSHDPL